MKAYNPLTLDVEVDKPTHMTDTAKWWRIRAFGDEKYGIAFRVQSIDGKENDFIVIKDNRPIYHTLGLEDLAYWYTQQELLERFDNEENS